MAKDKSTEPRDGARDGTAIPQRDTAADFGLTEGRSANLTPPPTVVNMNPADIAPPQAIASPSESAPKASASEPSSPPPSSE